MRALRMYAPKDIRLEDVPMLEPGLHDVVCRVKCAGLCGTDYSIYSGRASFLDLVTFPMTPGHEWSGVVQSVGSQVEDFKPGDRVVADTCVACGHCKSCLTGHYYQCNKLRAVGTIKTWDGGLAEYALMPSRHLFHLPENVDFDNGAIVEPVATAYHSILQAGVRPGDTVLVHGTGPIGIAAARLAKLAGAATVIITGRKDSKLRKALEMGADAAVNVSESPMVDTVRSVTGCKGLTHVIEASGSVQLFKESVSLVCPGGVIAAVAFYDEKLSDFNLDSLVLGDVTIKPVPGSAGTYQPVLALMAAGLLDFRPLITGRYALDQAPEAVIHMKDDPNSIKTIIDVDEH